MNEILSKQKELLKLIDDKKGGIHPYRDWGLQFYDCGTVVQYIKDNLFFLTEEVTELIVAIGGGDKAIYKNWSTRHRAVCSVEFQTSDEIKSEAIDVLCFCLNICLAVGITPENVLTEYEKVWTRSVARQSGTY